MVSRLRVRLRQARAAIERDLGCSLTAIVPRTDAGGPLSLGTRAQSYPQGSHAALDGGSAMLQRQRSALPHTAGSAAAQHPRSPPAQPHDSENDIARTILMLATPPAARAPSPRSPPQHVVGRRLSFSRCLDGDRTPKRARADESAAASRPKRQRTTPRPQRR